ncbi:MAG: sugar ABC transporter permease [Caldicoprobacter sp.]|uniref:carbohydrate ABC transporter permease n=1 Tax=Caldicoprobacter sp. TaxID=2004500 RepID=UPI0039C34D20
MREAAIKTSKKATRYGDVFSFWERENFVGYVFIAPWLIGFFVFTVYPIVYSFILSFTSYNIVSSPKFIGIDNYIEMFFKDTLYWKSVKATFYYVFTAVPLRLVFALLVAMLLCRKTRAIGIYRSALYIPSLIGGSVAVAVMWRRIFSEDGLLNAILNFIGIKSNIAWLGHPTYTIWTIILLGAWQFGSSMLIFLAGLKQIPETYYEAALIDGVGRFRKFFSITLPLLSPVIFFNLIMQLINGFMIFTQGLIITGGGPLNTTLFYALYLYRKAFQYYQMGYGCAMAWVMLVVVGILTALLFKTSKFWVYYEAKEG